MRSRYHVLFVLPFIAVLNGCFTVRNAIVGAGNRAEFKATAGAGFAGLPTAEVLHSPILPVNDEDPDSVKLIRNYYHSWRPALSTGLEVMFYSETKSQAGLGLGTHMVFVPDANGRTSPYPAVTFHAGNPGHEVFIGALFMPSSVVDFPNGGGSYVMEARPNGDYPDFVLPRKRRWSLLTRPTVYMGIQIAGVRVGERNAEEADEAASATVVKVELGEGMIVAPDTSIRVELDKWRPLSVNVLGRNGDQLKVPVRWGTEDASIAEIYQGQGVIGRKVGSTYLTATVGGLSRRFPVEVVGTTSVDPEQEVEEDTAP